MRLLLTTTGLPFTGSKIINDLRPSNTAAEQDAQMRIWFVTLFAVNTDAGGTSNVAASLLMSPADVPLPTTTLAAFSGTSADVVTVLERFPMRGPMALQVIADAEVMCFGYLETEAEEADLTPDPFYTGLPVSPFTLPTDRFVAADGLTLIHQLSGSEINEVTLTLDVQATKILELRFYSGSSSYVAFTFPGLMQVFEVLTRIPMIVEGSIQAVTTATATHAAAYGTVIRR